MATLTGKLSDVTNKTPENISSITVKAPSARVGSGTDVIVSSPATVDFNRVTGDITIRGLTGGLSWLYIEGDGWTDSIALSVAEGMITLVEAVANAAGVPGLADYIHLLAELETRIDGIAQDAVDEAAENIRWFKGFIDDTHATMADVPIGLWGISAQTHAVRLGLPADFGTLQVMTMGSSRAAFFIGRTIGLYINTSQDDVWGEWHQPWAEDKWFKGPITSDHQTMADVGVGVWNVPARNLAVRLGLPMDYGSLQVMQIGLSKTAFFIGQSTGFWVNSSDGDVWGEWQRPTGSGGSGGGGAAGLKTVGMALTAGSLLNGLEGRYRVLAQVTAPVLRWRIHVESHRMLSNTTSAFTLGAVYIGSHSGNGAMTGQQQIKSGNLSVPADGEWVSPWLDASMLANETLIDLNVSGSELYRSQATSWIYENGSWVSSKNSPVSIWVELETYDQVPVVGMIGDSTGAGQGADRPVFDSALYIAARKNKFIPMAYTYPGSSMQSINDYGFHLFQRWAHLDKPDSVIIQSGSNDIHAGASTSELQARFSDLVETAEVISQVVIGATVKARYPNSGDHQTNLNAHNAFVKTRANGNRDYLDFYQVVSPSGTVASADAADAAHLSTSGHQKLATAFDSVTVSRPAWIDTISGTGSPEGKVAAPVGSIYTDTAATNGAILWIKASGTGNTGWRDYHGDTNAAVDALGQRMGAPLPAGADLDTLTTPGKYYSDVRETTDSLLNLPDDISPEPFALQVVTHSVRNGTTRQTITQKVPWQPDTRKWERVSLANNWLEWVQIWPVDLSGKADINHTHDASKISNLDKFVDARIPEERRWDLTTTSITWWGDSQVETGSNGVLWPPAEQMPQQAGQHLTTPMINNGRSGATSNYVLAKAGVIKLYVEPVTIPASGQVDVTVTGVPITPTSNTNLNGMILAGVRGTLRYYPDRWVFLRESTGDAVTLTEPTLVETTTPIDPEAAHVVVMGGNDWITPDYAPEEDRTTHTIAAYQRMVEAVPGLGADKKIIIGGIKTRRDTAAGDENDRYVREVNDRLAELYPAHFVPYQHWLATRALTAAGITPTEGDLTQMAAGLAPASAFDDQTHLKKTVVAAMAREVWAPELAKRGWSPVSGDLPDVDWWPTPGIPLISRVDSLEKVQTLTGEGFPEGEVSAPVGTTYVDSLATAGAVRWIKTTGDGSTGWKVEYGDTGWRSRDADFLATGSVMIRRINNDVYLKIGTGQWGIFTFHETSPAAEVILPLHFRPSGNEFMDVRYDSTKAVVGAVSIQSNGWFSPRMDAGYTDTSRNLQTSVAVYPTEHAWPSSLPGTPA